MKRVPLTIGGAEKMRAEIRTLKGEARPRVVRAISEARGHGDLKENWRVCCRTQRSSMSGAFRETRRSCSAQL